MASKNKGSKYERAICRELSMWFSHDTADDWFWRSAGSGARATARGKRGRSTKGQGGDIAPTCQEGEVLTSLVSIEVKRGYASTTIHDLIDKSDRAKVQQFELWIEQAENASIEQDTFAWLLITKRDQRDALMTMPIELFLKLKLSTLDFVPMVTFKYRSQRHSNRGSCVTVKLSEFLELVPTNSVKKASQWWKRTNQ